MNEAASSTPVPSDPQPAGKALAIEMRGVAFGSMSDQRLTVAEDVDWSVNAGEFWVVAGSQRSGKSDFLMLTGGLLPPKHGTYRFFGKEMPIFEDDRLDERLRLGLVFDGGQLFNQMTIAENVALPLRYHRDLTRDAAGPRVQAMLEFAGLLPLANNTPGTVARNWQKRAGLARALMLQPEVLLLDNPFSGLDPRHAAWWMNCLEQLSAGDSFFGGRPVTIVAATDDLSRLALPGGQPRQFAVLKEKRLHVIGTRDQLLRSTDPLVKDLLAGAAPEETRESREAEHRS